MLRMVKVGYQRVKIPFNKWIMGNTRGAPEVEPRQAAGRRADPQDGRLGLEGHRKTGGRASACLL